MIKIAALVAMCMVPSLYAQTEVPSIDDSNPALDLAVEKYNADTKLFEEIMAELRTNDLFGGRYIEVPFRGKTYSIDRTSELVWYKKTVNPPRPNVTALAGLLSGGKGSGSLNIRIRVTYREVNPDGTKHEEIWEIDSGAFLEAQIGMDEAMSKQHK